MKPLKFIGIGLVAVIALAMVAGMLLPSMVHVERTATIDAPAPIIYANVVNLEKWEAWSNWAKKDPEMKVTYGDSRMGEGASYSWVSEENGNGELTIKSAVKNESITTRIDFGEMGVAEGMWSFVENEGNTEVTWGFDSDMGSMPWDRLLGLLMDKFVGEDFEKGLANLKEVTESIELPDIQIVQNDMEAHAMISIRDKCNSADIGSKLAELYGEMMVYLVVSGGEMKGMPGTIYHSYDAEGETELEAFFMLESALEGDGRIVSGNSPSGEMISTTHIGPYSTMAATYDKLTSWMAIVGISPTGAPYEIYVDDPETVEESALKTEIYFPVN